MATSKQDYEAIAKIIDDAHLRVMDHGDLASIHAAEGLRLWLASQIGEYFKTQNSRFDKSRFLTACNKGGLTGQAQSGMNRGQARVPK